MANLYVGWGLVCVLRPAVFGNQLIHLVHWHQLVPKKSFKKIKKVLKDFQGGLGPTKQTMDRVSPAVYYTQLFEWGKNSLSGPAGGLKKTIISRAVHFILFFQLVKKKKR